MRSLPGYSRGEIAFVATREKVVHLDDVLLRRSMVAMLGHVTRQAVTEVGEVLAEHLGWDARRRESEITRALEILKDQHQVDL